MKNVENRKKPDFFRGVVDLIYAKKGKNYGERNRTLLNKKRKKKKERKERERKENETMFWNNV